ncbi:hypothetical protein Q1695_012295 [Nippostrongylus brasiliensis]|nr:hypothetical protein Q1695_012295 [Nippostrongylus brasiliensis]
MAWMRLVYGSLIVLAFVLTLISLFTPGWRSYSGGGAPDFGLVTYYCGDGNRRVLYWDCTRWANTKSYHEKVTLTFMIIASVLQAVAIACVFTLFSHRLRMAIPTAGVCASAFLSLLVAVVVFGVCYRSKVVYMASTTYELIADVHLGYAYWLAVVATGLTLLATVISSSLIGPRHESFDCVQ